MTEHEHEHEAPAIVQEPELDEPAQETPAEEPAVVDEELVDEEAPVERVIEPHPHSAGYGVTAKFQPPAQADDEELELEEPPA